MDKLKTPTGRIHRNFKLSKQTDRLLRSRAKRINKTQTAIIEDALKKVHGYIGEVIHLRQQTAKLLFREATRLGRDPMTVLEDCIHKTLKPAA